MSPVIAPTIDVVLDPADLRQSLRREVQAGLRLEPKSLPPKWFYDDYGSSLFDEITRLPEYYLTRREREILYSESVAIARLSEADTLVELGSGTSEKTRLLLDAFSQVGNLTRYVPFDVSEVVLRRAAHDIAERHPGILVHAIVGDFARHLSSLPAGGRRIIAFLGSTIGNFEPADRARFLDAVAQTLEPVDWLLLGTDLVKDPGRLEAAYNDAAGVTAAFNRNVLAVLNRELEADFELPYFEHVARYERESSWIAMYLRSARQQTVSLAELGLRLDFAANEHVRTEISTKFTRTGVEAELTAAGLELAHWWTDSHGDFALSLSRPGR